MILRRMDVKSDIVATINFVIPDLIGNPGSLLPNCILDPRVMARFSIKFNM